MNTHRLCCIRNRKFHWSANFGSYKTGGNLPSCLIDRYHLGVKRLHHWLSQLFISLTMLDIIYGCCAIDVRFNKRYSTGGSNIKRGHGTRAVTFQMQLFKMQIKDNLVTKELSRLIKSFFLYCAFLLAPKELSAPKIIYRSSSSSSFCVKQQGKPYWPLSFPHGVEVGYEVISPSILRLLYFLRDHLQVS